MEEFKDEIISNLDAIVGAIDKGNDIIIKKTRDGSLKILFYKPKNITKLI